MEAALQVMGKAGAHQVPGARTALRPRLAVLLHGGGGQHAAVTNECGSLPQRVVLPKSHISPGNPARRLSIEETYSF